MIHTLTRIAVFCFPIVGFVMSVSAHGKILPFKRFDAKLPVALSLAEAALLYLAIWR